MIRFFKRGSVAIVVMMMLCGCVSEEIYNVKDAPVTAFPGNELTLNQVGKAIVVAGVGLHWQMALAEPGHIVGTLNLRTHQAVVDVNYDTKFYSITYKSSKNLLIVDGNGNPSGIHRNYNSWIRNLDNAIRAQIVASGT